MKRFLITTLSVLICSLCFAQSLFSSYVLNGDVKMREKFYEMALSFYNRALESAANDSERSLAEQKIAECNRILNPPKEKTPKTSSAVSRALFSDQYLETGDVYSFEKDEVIYADDDDSTLSLYMLEVRSDCVIILSHSDGETDQQLDYLPAGTVIPLKTETSILRRYASDVDGEEFIVYKKASKNEYGQFYVVLRKEKNRYYRLYSSVEFRTIMKSLNEANSTDIENKSGDEINDENGANNAETSFSESFTDTTSEKPLPIHFSDFWAFNVDGNGTQTGDSRYSALNSADVQRLCVCIRYSCPEGYNESVRFDVKAVDPDGVVMDCNRSGSAPGYSSFEMLETDSGGGVFNVYIEPYDAAGFIPGKYFIGIWNDGVHYYSAVIELL